LETRTRVILGLHQEDKRVFGVEMLRPYLDIGIVLLRRNVDGSVNFFDFCELKFERETQMEIMLDPGSYILLPKTTGCIMRRSTDDKPPSLSIITKNGELTRLAECAISDIFRKFDMLLNRELSYIEFKGFLECINKSITEKEFQVEILQRYSSTTKGVTLRGFLDFWRDSILSTGEEAVWKWFEQLGYERDLFSTRSRAFLLTIHRYDI
jgi:hypothetical protein